ncbi:MAG: serine kinase [Candidatus Coatesbacteria bacterium]|nr:serine kinase [Candidatus Coatesbacteria bacterium]
MRIKEIIEKLNLTVYFSPEEDAEITGGYACDLLSDVMGHADAGSIWVTIQTHQNIVAVAVLANLPAIVLSRGVKPQDLTIDKCRDESVYLLGTEETTFEMTGRLYDLGIRGTKR